MGLNVALLVLGLKNVPHQDELDRLWKFKFALKIHPDKIRGGRDDVYKVFHEAYGVVRMHTAPPPVPSTSGAGAKKASPQTPPPAPTSWAWDDEETAPPPQTPPAASTNWAWDDEKTAPPPQTPPGASTRRPADTRCGSAGWLARCSCCQQYLPKQAFSKQEWSDAWRRPVVCGDSGARCRCTWEGYILWEGLRG